MLAKLKEQPAVEKLIAQYDQLPKRDQQALSVLSIAVLLGVLYLAVWQPASQFHEQTVASRENARELVQWMQANESAIRSLGTGGAAGNNPSAQAPEDGRALMALVTGSAREAGLALQRFEPTGEDAIRVWLENVAYAEVAAWLGNLSTNHGVIVDQAAMDRASEPGRVSVRLTLAI